MVSPHRRLGYPAAMRRLPILCLLIGLALAADRAGAAPPIRLDLPIDCVPGETCWIPNYVDVDPGPGARNFRCDPLTYDAHKGTDFAIRDLAAMRQGVTVRAAAAGTVVGRRDGVTDADLTESVRAAVRGRECGNGVLVDHGAGWFTRYCHLRRGSVAVRKGDRVAAGDRLGLVGHSGLAEFPHLHFQVRLDARTPDGAKTTLVIDPFIGIGRRADACGPGPEPLWSETAAAALVYLPAMPYAAGFYYRPPKPDEARRGGMAPDELSVLSPNLVLWADTYGVRKGDVLRMTITGPGGGTFFASEIRAEKDQARFYRYGGRKRKADPWPAGTYSGVFEVIRQGPDGREKRFAIRRRVTVR